MIFVKTFKGYEDKTMQLDESLNEWLAAHKVDVVDIKSVLAHEPDSKTGSGDLIYTVLYRAETPVD